MKKPQLCLLHFAGGNRYSFRFLVPYLKDFELIVPELPGRGGRMSECLIKDFDLAALDLMSQITAKLGHGDVLLYGHSMGAYLALRIANMLEQAGRPPVCLFVTGNAGPAVKENKNVHLLGEDDFCRELKEIGGVPEEFYTNAEFYDFFEPILRADFEIVEKKDLSGEQPSSAPVFAMMGSREENAGLISHWVRYTRSTFDYELLEGDHFFIYDHPQKIAFSLLEHYRRSLAVPAKI